MLARFRFWWKQLKIHPARTTFMALLAVVIVLIVLIFLGYIFNWDWTGLNGYKTISTATSLPPKITTTITYQPGKTLWDWLQLLIIPAVLAVAGYVINLSISRGEQAATEQRAQSEREAAEKRSITEREISLDNQREAALKEYIDEMSELLLHENLLGSDEDDKVRIIARVRTITILYQLDARRIGYVFSFLRESKLMHANPNDSIISLANAQLNKINFRQAIVEGVNLSRVKMDEANLSDAEFFLTDLSKAHLVSANLCEATLDAVNLSGALLMGANLSGASLLMTNLSKAILLGANLSGAYFNQTNLREADLTGANLKDAIDISVKELEMQAKSLKGATMPDGSKHD